MQKDYEKLLKKVIFKDLKKGRKDWDLPHTKAVVHYIKEIFNSIKNIKLDKDVLIISAYAHDWGYINMFNNKIDNKYDEILNLKQEHMKIGAELIKNLLTKTEFNFLTNLQKQRIIHLVEIHDKLKEISAIDERILVEADTLGSLDTSFVKPSFTKEENDKYMEATKNKRFPLFYSTYGKNIFDSLYKKRIEYYQNF